MRYLITFSYDGSKYSGYQKQPNTKTIQGEIEKCLTQINGNKTVSIHASGRTDAGVHALNQKAHFDMECSITPDRLKHSLNGMLPKDIYIKNIEIVDDNFHARFDVKTKEYRYELNMGEYNPILKDYVCQWNKELNLEEIKKGLTYLEGTHDFKSFTKATDEIEDYIRTIMEAKLVQDERDKNHITFIFIGTGFLRYQVRNMVGTLIEIGENKKKSEEIIDILKANDRQKAGITAPASGLYLKDVHYE